MSSDSMTITVPRSLGEALIAAGAASEAFGPAPAVKADLPYADIVRRLSRPQGGTSGEDLRNRRKMMTDMLGLAEIAPDSGTEVVHDGHGRPVELDRLLYQVPGMDAGMALFHLPGEEPTPETRYAGADSADGRTGYFFSQAATARVTDRPLGEVLADALARDLPQKRPHRVIFEDNGCEVRTNGADGLPLRLVRYRTLQGSVYATGPLSTMPLLGMETEVMARDLGKVREPSGTVRALLCEPGDTGRMVKWERHQGGWRR